MGYIQIVKTGVDYLTFSTLLGYYLIYTKQMGRLYMHFKLQSVFLGCCCAGTKPCPPLCDTMDCSLVRHSFQEFVQIHVTESLMLYNHLNLCCPLLLLPSTFASIRVFSNKSALPIRWSEYWNFSISSSNEYSGLISFRIDQLTD